MTGVPAGLRARLEADYAPVRVLHSPVLRALWVAPLAIVTFVAAPIAFNVRADAGELGWFGSWGASLCQVIAGLVVIAASLRESIPGRQWSRGLLALWIALPITTVVVVTLASWESSQVLLGRGWWFVGALCLGGSVVSALPVVTLAGVLAARAYPTRPAIAGALLGLGAGLVADAGWRMFCHFTEPAHVLSAHLGGVVIAAAIGSGLAVRLCQARKTRSTNQ